MRAKITEAIKQMRLLSFTYDGHYRVVEPHCFGITTAGHEAIRCFQVEGTGNRPDSSPWHLMTTDKMISLAVLDKTFSGPRAGYRRGDRHMDTIFAEL